MTNPKNKAAKAGYLKLRRMAAEIFTRHDPIGLIAMGAPADEYDPEIGTILPRLREARDEEDVRRMVHAEFVRWFGPDLAGSEASYTVSASELWLAWLAVGEA
jgi:hypothetical protein